MFDRRRPPKNHPNREDYSQRIIDVILQSSIPEKQVSGNKQNFTKAIVVPIAQYLVCVALWLPT